MDQFTLPTDLAQQQVAVHEYQVVGHDVTIASRIVPCDHGGQYVVGQRFGHDQTVARR